MTTSPADPLRWYVAVPRSALVSTGARLAGGRDRSALARRWPDHELVDVTEQLPALGDAILTRLGDPVLAFDPSVFVYHDPAGGLVALPAPLHVNPPSLLPRPSLLPSKKSYAAPWHEVRPPVAWALPDGGMGPERSGAVLPWLVKIQAERKAGELLAKVKREPRGHGKTAPGKKSNAESTLVSALKEAELAPTTAKRWQKMAEVGEAEIRRLEHETTAEVPEADGAAYRDSIMARGERFFVAYSSEPWAVLREKRPDLGTWAGRRWAIFGEEPTIADVTDQVAAWYGRVAAAAAARWTLLLLAVGPGGPALTFTGDPRRPAGEVKALQGLMSVLPGFARRDYGRGTWYV